MPIVILPRKSLIKMDERTITVDVPSTSNSGERKKDYSILERTRGIWKDKNIDPVKYQRKIRSEWERKFK